MIIKLHKNQAQLYINIFQTKKKIQKKNSKIKLKIYMYIFFSSPYSGPVVMVDVVVYYSACKTLRGHRFINQPENWKTKIIFNISLHVYLYMYV